MLKLLQVRLDQGCTLTSPVLGSASELSDYL